jgi:hypothetical protein
MSAARYPTYAPQFKVLINDQPLPIGLRGSMTSLTYQDGIEGADRVEVTFANQNLRWLDNPILQVDNGFKLSIGYAPDPLEEVFVGEITGVEPSFPSSGMPAIKVVALDFLNRLTKGAKKRAFALNLPKIADFPIPDPIVASIVAGENLLIPYPDPVGTVLSVLMTIALYIQFPTMAKNGILVQRGVSDFQFLTQIAKKNGWELFIDHTTQPHGRILRFKSLMGDRDSSLTLKYGSSLIDFTPRLTTVGDIFGVAVKIWVSALKIQFIITVSWDYDRAAFNMSISPGFGDLGALLGGDAANKTIEVAPTGFAQAPQAILTELLPRLNNRLTGSGNAIGDLRIKGGRVITLDGLGDQFSGKYRITQATHSFGSSGYRTAFQVRKEIWFGGIPTPTGASGLFRVQGQTFK